MAKSHRDIVIAVVTTLIGVLLVAESKQVAIRHAISLLVFIVCMLELAPRWDQRFHVHLLISCVVGYLSLSLIFLAQHGLFGQLIKG